MDRESVMTWVDGYQRAWREMDVAGLDALFTADALYLHSPYERPLVGLEAIRADWSDPTPFTMSAEPVAVEGERAVVRALVSYGGDEPQEYLDLWVLEFAPDGRVATFEEWPYWPGKPWSAAHGSPEV